MSAASSATPPSKPAALLHLAQARRNYELYQELKLKGDHLDWAVTVLFYTTLHLIQAYLVEIATTGFDVPRDHQSRDQLIVLRLPPVFSDYAFLRTRSNWARYFPDRPRPTPAQLQQYESNQFARILAELQSLGVSLGS